ncbi:unnamed protein product [Phytomonas sp. Hart1]|nr:unnamed protein product [Phytomonas sp. Hart1]|eukprot:CCW70426.1 unnamed protein product [Phytomonas sp. isolate Hart1]
MPLIFVHHHKNEVTAFNTECTIGSLNTALVDLANNGDSNGTSKSNLGSHFSAMALRSKANDRSSQITPVEDSGKEKTGSLSASPHIYKKVELLPLSFVLEIASNPKLIASLNKRNTSNCGAMAHSGTPSQAFASISPTDGNIQPFSVNNFATSLLSSYAANIPFVGLRTAPEQSAYFSLPGLCGSTPSSTTTTDIASGSYPALVLIGCRMDSLKESGSLNHLGGSNMLPALDDRKTTPQSDFDERKLGIKSGIHDNHSAPRSAQQISQPLPPFVSGHLHDSMTISATLESALGAAKYDSVMEMGSGITDKALDHVSFTGILNLIRNAHLTPHWGSKGVRDDPPVLITHPILPTSNEGTNNAVETDAAEGLEKQGSCVNEDNISTQSKALSTEEGATPGSKIRNSLPNPSIGKEANKRKSELTPSAAGAAGIGAGVNGTPPIPFSRAVQDLLLCPQRPTSSPAPVSQSNNRRLSTPSHTSGGNGAEKPQSMALWLKGVESLDVLWTSSNGEHEILSWLLQDFVRIEKQKMAADGAARVAALPIRRPTVLASGGSADPPKSKK